MDSKTSIAGVRTPAKKKHMKSPTTVQSLSRDTLCIIFSFLDFLDLIWCSAVCKSWNSVISTSTLFQALYSKERSSPYRRLLDKSTCMEKEELSKIFLKDLAKDRHRITLEERSIDIYQWISHSAPVNQCRMKKGLVLTGGDDKVMRLWSVESCKYLEDYLVPDRAPLTDFDFDESKIVGLVGTSVCIWRRNGKRHIFSSRAGEIPKASCMCYVDPEAVVGCEDGRARFLDMYSRKWSKIVKIHDGPVSCISLSDSQIIVGGSTIGTITISDLSSAHRVATLRSYGSAGISTMYVHHSSPLIFAGSTVGQAYCWDLRTMRNVWQTRVSPNVLYSMHQLRNLMSPLVTGGIDGVLRMVDQNTGKVLSNCILDQGTSEANTGKVLSNCILDQGTSEAKRVEHPNKVSMRKGRRITDDSRLDLMPRASRPSITCLAVGWEKVVTTHDDNYIRIWKFGK